MTLGLPASVWRHVVVAAVVAAAVVAAAAAAEPQEYRREGD